MSRSPFPNPCDQVNWCDNFCNNLFYCPKQNLTQFVTSNFLTYGTNLMQVRTRVFESSPRTRAQEWIFHIARVFCEHSRVGFSSTHEWSYNDGLLITLIVDLRDLLAFVISNSYAVLIPDALASDSILSIICLNSRLWRALRRRVWQCQD